MTEHASAADPLHTPEPGDSWWSTTNLAEAFPGVLTPLDWSLVGPGVERGTRGALVAIGALPQAEGEMPTSPADRAFGVFHGRIASRIDFFHELGARMPGTTPDAVVTQIFGSVPEGLESRPSARRYGIIAGRFPATFAMAPRRTRAMRAETRRWWEDEILAMPGRDRDAARAALRAAVDRVTRNLTIDGTLLLAGAQPIYDQLSRLAERTGVDASTLMRGAGSHEETQVVADVWEASRGRLPLPILLERHGFHGPSEGLPSGRPWREDTRPLADLVETFRKLPDDRDPRLVDAQGQAARAEAERTLLQRLPRRERPAARTVLRLAGAYLPLRGKAARTQAIDVVRAAARRLGACLHAEGVLEDPDDVLLLTVEELVSGDTAGVRELVEIRRAQLERHRRFDLPGVWRGRPEPIEVATRSARATVNGGLPELEGVAASTGVVEGRARVVFDPGEATDLAAGEILVTRTTDPSWAALMFISGALVVDIGGLLSHAAIVARELGLPCVMGTGSGTVELRTGDLCRVDGTTGRVQVLQRA